MGKFWKKNPEERPEGKSSKEKAPGGEFYGCLGSERRPRPEGRRREPSTRSVDTGCVQSTSGPRLVHVLPTIVRGDLSTSCPRPVHTWPSGPPRSGRFCPRSVHAQDFFERSQNSRFRGVWTSRLGSISSPRRSLRFARLSSARIGSCASCENIVLQRLQRSRCRSKSVVQFVARSTVQRCLVSSRIRAHRTAGVCTHTASLAAARSSGGRARLDSDSSASAKAERRSSRCV